MYGSRGLGQNVAYYEQLLHVIVDFTVVMTLISEM